jgi:chromate transporter
MAIFCAWRAGGLSGGLVGGLCFIAPGFVVILGLSALFFARHTPLWVHGASAGAGAAVPAVALAAAASLLPDSWRRAHGARPQEVRWVVYVAAGALAGALVGEYLVFVLAAAGGAEVVARWHPGDSTARMSGISIFAVVSKVSQRLASGRWTALAALPAVGGLGALAFVAFKVGALSYGGGFVIIPLMQHDAVVTYHFMTRGQFLDAVALGQVTPGPVVLTVAAVGYAAKGVAGAALATVVAFAPSFVFVLGGARHFGRLRSSARVQAFLIGGGACAIGAIAGASIPLCLAVAHLWQAAVTILVGIWLLAVRRSVVPALITAAAAGTVAALAGAPVGVR